MSADVSARLAWPDDAPAIAQVQLEAWGVTYPADVVASVTVADLAERWGTVLERPADARVRVLVALEHATVRGFVLVHPGADDDADPARDGEIGELVVDPRHRGEGHGSRLLQAAVDTLRADGFTAARWWVGTTDDTLRSWITETGWAPDGAHRELAAEDDAARLRQVRLHTALA